MVDPSALADPSVASTSRTASYVLVSSCCESLYFLPFTTGITDTHMAGLLWYDYILMLAVEVRLIWRAPLNLASAFYLCIRYGFMLQIGLTMLHNFHRAKDPPFSSEG